MPVTVLSAWGISVHGTHQDPCPCGQRVPLLLPLQVFPRSLMERVCQVSISFKCCRRKAELCRALPIFPSHQELHRFSPTEPHQGTPPHRRQLQFKIQTRNEKHGVLSFQQLRRPLGCQPGQRENGITGLGLPSLSLSASGSSKTKGCCCGEKLREHEAHLHGLTFR